MRALSFAIIRSATPSCSSRREPAPPSPATPPPEDGLPRIDRTAKLYIDGRQARPDGGYSAPVVGPDGALVGEIGVGNRKDIRNAVEAARKA